MTGRLEDKVSRVATLLDAARAIASPSSELGSRARRILRASTGLSPEGVAYALEHCLETHPEPRDVEKLCAGVPDAPSAHVLLSANVFTAAHRAIAIAAAASPRVHVRPSRREPETAALLHEASRGAFRLVDELMPEPGDHVWAYASDETLRQLQSELPAGVIFHPHGSGMGLAIVEQEMCRDSDIDVLADALARDVAVFDQRGCASPRALWVLGDAPFADRVAEASAVALREVEQRIPRGTLSDDERADLARYRDTMAFAADLRRAGKGFVALDFEPDRFFLPPVGRNLHVTRVTQPEQLLQALEPHVTCVGIHASAECRTRVQTLLPGARVVDVGMMQRPRFDGPVDRRARSSARTL